MNVSIIIPVYNAELYLEQSVSSALDQAQTGEVVLAEDGSSDRSLAICERLASKDHRVKLLRHPGGRNQGAAASRNLGVEHARCDLVAFLDADDLYRPGRFDRAEAILGESEDVDGVYEAVGVHLENVEARQWWQERHGTNELTTVTRPVAPERLFETLMMGGCGFMHTNGVTVRREFFERCGRFHAKLRMCQDTCMWMQMAAVGRLAAGRLDEAVAVRRIHGENRIIRHADAHLAYHRKMWRELLRWAEAQRLGEARCRMLLERVCNTSRMGRTASDGWLSTKVAEVGLWLDLLRRSSTARRSGVAVNGLLMSLGGGRFGVRYKSFEEEQFGRA